MTRTFATIVISTIFVQNVHAQNNPMDNILPPSPQAANFMRYGEIPVSPATGIPQIEIPLYTISYDGVEVPISISYHASGIKVDDVASCVGLGWVLNASGMISRVIQGFDDFYPSKHHNNKKRFYYPSSRNVYNTIQQLYSNYHESDGLFCAQMACDTLLGMCGNNYSDSQSDKYFYSCNGMTGRFRYDVDKDTLVLLPYKPLLIERNGGKGFRITNENGTVFIFSVLERTTQTVRTICNRKDPVVGDHSVPYQYAVTGWYLSSIITPSKKDTISFQYEQDDIDIGLVRSISAMAHQGRWFDSMPEEDPWNFYYGHYHWTVSNDKNICYDQSLVSNSFFSPLIKSITWKGNSVDFFYDNDRPESGCGLRKDLRLSRLSRIVVKSHGNKRIRTITFEKSQLGNGDFNRRLLLQGLSICGTDSTQEHRYLFDYNRKALPSYVAGFNSPCNYDYFGYYNGRSDWSHIPALPNFQTSVVCSDREPNNNAQCGILTTITYPTGGTSMFTYEMNSNKCGLRIKSITSKIGNKIIKKEEYKYPYGDSSKNRSVTDVNLFTYNTEYIFQSIKKTTMGYWLDNRSYTHACTTSCPSTALTPLFGNCAFYDYIVKDVTDGNGDSISCTEYRYVPDHETVRHEDLLDQFDCNIEPRFFSAEKNYDYGYVTPILLSQKDYQYVNGKKKLFREVSNSYETARTGVEPIVGVSICLDYNAVVYALPDTPQPWHPFHSPAELAERIYVCNIYAEPHYKRLVSSETIEHGIHTTTTYTYDPSGRTLQPLTVTTSRPGGVNVRKQYTYPFQLSDSVMQAMARDNYVDLVVGEDVYLDGVTASRSRDIYTKSGNRYQLDEKQYAIGSNPLKKRLKVIRYDPAGNILEAEKDNDSHQFFIWGYGYQYPIMKIDCPIGQDSALMAYIEKRVVPLGRTIVPNESYVNDIRTCAEGLGALVFTYKYKPLVGLTEVEDEHHIKTTYTYDNMNRLSGIYDINGKLVESYKYNYSH